MKTYAELEALPPEAYLDASLFKTTMDGYPPLDYAGKQYQNGLDIGRSAKHVSISIRSVWGAELKTGAHVSSAEGIGYHACTSDLLRGFLDSGVSIIVHRLVKGEVQATKIK